MPPINGSDDIVWISGPNERLGLLVMFVDEAIDGGLKIDHGMEHASFQPALGQLGEEALDGIEPGGRCWGEVEGPAGMAGEPLADLFVFMRAVIVEDDVDHLAGGDVTFDDVQEAKELLVTMALHIAADHGAVEHVERGE